MKGIIAQQYGTADVLQYKILELPTIQANEVKIRLHAAGVNPSDVYTLSGTYAIKPSLPYTPCLDGAGVVEEIGSEVTNIAVGDRVFVASLPVDVTTGTLAEQIVCAQKFVFPLPAHISFEQGAALGIPAFTAYRALLEVGQLQQGQTVFIHGASGAVGLQAVQIAKAIGTTVIGTASKQRGKDFVKQAGADIVLDHLTESNKQALLDATDGRGPDLIIEFLANKNLAIDLDVITKNGTIVIVGNRGDIQINPRVIMQKECTVKGMVLFNVTEKQHRVLGHHIVDLLEQQKLTPVVGKVFELPQAAQAFDAVISGTFNGKVVVKI